MATPLPQPNYVRLTHEAKRRGVHRSWLYRAAKRGDITIITRGGASFVCPAEIDHFIEHGVGQEVGQNA